MGIFSIWLVFVLLGTDLKPATAHNNVTVEISIFYNASDRYMPNILQNAEDMFLTCHQEKKPRKENLNVQINRQWLDEAEIAGNEIRITHSLFNVWNISLRTQGAIFVDINSNSLFLSSMLERSAIPTVGIFQTREQQRTQESPADFSRVALPSMRHYAQVIWEVMKKTERRSVCLVLSADTDGKELAESIVEMAKREKWMIKGILWLIQNRNTSLQIEMKSIQAKQSDVVVVHSRDRDNGLLFQAIQYLSIYRTGTLWILTDITEHGVPDIEAFQVGMLKISAKKRQPFRDQSFYSDVIYDALLLYEAAFERAYGSTRYDSSEGDCLPNKDGNTGDIQDLAKIYLKETFIEGKSSLFLEPSLYETSQTTFEIWNLRQNQNTATKHWALVGLKTPTGFALDTLMTPNGSALTAPTVPVTHVMRVPVNEYDPWVQTEEPRLDNKGMFYCLGRGQLCYKYGNSSRHIKTTLCCFGVSIDLLGMMQNELGFRSEIYFTPDGNYGDFDEETKAWNGIVQEVLSGKADFAIDISMNALREEYLEFAHPFIHLALNILVLKDLQVNNEIQWSSWLEPFQYQLWLSIVGFINFILLVIWWIDRKSPYGHYKDLDSGDDGFTLLDSMTYVWGVAFSKDIGAEKTPCSSSARCVSTFYAFFSLIVINTYCANLMAFLVQESFELPISGIRDSKIRHPSLQPPKGFRLGIQQDSQEASYFKFHSEDVFREIYRVNLKVNFVENFADGIEKLKNREINGLVGDYLSLSQVANKDPNCSFSLAGPNFFNFGLGLALPKASPWISDVNQAVLKHQENGTIQTIEKRWFNKNSCDSKPFTALGIINFSGLFMTVVVVLGFCVFAVLAEFFIVIMLIRLGTRLGAFGKFIKRFAFNVKEGEEDELNMKYSFLLRRQRKASWNVTPSAETTDMFQELGFHNDASFSSRVHGFHSDTCHTPNGQCFHDNSHFTPDRQSIKVGKLNQEGTAHNSVYENYEMINGRSTLTDYKYMNGYDNSKTKSVKENGFMVTKL